MTQKNTREPITLPWATKFKEILHTPDLTERDMLNAFAKYCRDKETELNQRWNK